MIAFTCSRCQHALTRHDNEAGSKIACPACGHRLVVPSAPGDAAARIRCVCPQCRAAINAEPHRAGTMANCPRCGAFFDVPQPPKPDLRVTTEQSIMLAPSPSPTAPSVPTSPQAAPGSGGISLLTALGWSIVGVSGAIVLMLALCCGFGWTVYHSNERGRIAYLKNDIASQESKAAALEVELNAALARGDNNVAQRCYEDMALAFDSVGRDCDQLAIMLPAGNERDDYVRTGQDRRNRAEACRTSAAFLRSARR